MQQKIIFLIFVLLILSFCCFKETTLAQTQSDTIKSPPLILKVTTPKQTICLGTNSIMLNAEMKNISEIPVTIDKNYLWNGSISVHYRHAGIVDGWASGRTAQIPYTGNFLQLEPGEKYSEKHNLVLTEKQEFEGFFKRIGHYNFTISYLASDLDDESAEIRKWLYTKPISADLRIKIIKCR